MLKRWRAVASYKADNGIVSFAHEFDELEELHDLIEAGPDWTTLDKIEVRYNMDFIEAEPEKANDALKQLMRSPSPWDWQ